MKKRHKPEEGLSPEDMGTWCRMEVRNVLKECELRLNEAMDLTTAYQQGRLSRKEANARLDRYSARWNEAIGGMDAEEHTNEQIMAVIDEQIDPDLLPPLQTGSMVSKVKRSRSAGRRSK